MRKQKGFSLVELLLVVAIILIISAIAVPSLLRSRIAANEASAVGSLRNITTAQVTYASTYPTIGYALNLATLGPGTVQGNTDATSTSAVLLDGVLGCPTGTGNTPCTKAGYYFEVTGDGLVPSQNFTSTAVPIAPDQSGKRYFYTDSTNIIRYNFTQVATSSDNALQ